MQLDKLVNINYPIDVKLTSNLYWSHYSFEMMSLTLKKHK